MRSDDRDATYELSRRNFLRTGVFGTLALSTISVSAMLTGCSSPPAATGFRLLRENDLRVLRALLPVVLAGALPASGRTAAAEATLHSLDEFLYGTSIAGHKQVSQLFDLLAMPFTRYTMAGLSRDWDKSSEQDLNGFLDKWRYSRFQLLRAGYQGLTQLIVMSWYLQPEAGTAIGYVPPHVVMGESA